MCRQALTIHEVDITSFQQKVLDVSFYKEKIQVETGPSGPFGRENTVFVGVEYLQADMKIACSTLHSARLMGGNVISAVNYD